MNSGHSVQPFSSGWTTSLISKDPVICIAENKVQQGPHLVPNDPGNDPPAVLAAGWQETKREGQQEEEYDVIASAPYRFKSLKWRGKSPHANKVLVLGIDVGQLHVQEHQDLRRANSTSEAEPKVDNVQLRERQGPGLCIFSLAAEFYLPRFFQFAPAVLGRIWAAGREVRKKFSYQTHLMTAGGAAVTGLHTDTLFTHWYTVFTSSCVTMSTNLMHGTFNLDICFLTMVSKAMSGVKRPLLRADKDKSHTHKNSVGDWSITK